MPKILRYATFAEEAEYDADPAPAEVFAADIESASLDAPSDTELEYGGGLGRSLRTHRPGWYAPSGNVVAASDIVTVGWLLKWALGGYVHTDDAAGSGFQIHELFGTDDDGLPSFATRIGKDVFQHLFSGCAMGQLQLQTDSGYFKATPDISAARDAKEDLLDYDTVRGLLPDEFPLAFHEVTSSVAGGDVSAVVRSLQLTIANNLQDDAARGIGSRHPRRQVAGERMVTFQLQLRYENTDHLERFWGAAGGPSEDGTTEFPVQLNLDAGDDGNAVIDLPRTIYSGVQTQPSGRGELVQTLDGKAYRDEITLDDGLTSVSSELLATLSNNQPEMTA